jgi:transcriptional regulator with XRE-family HTH domain
MTKTGKNLNQIVTKTATQWKQRAAKDRVNRKKISRAQKFALELLEYLDENNIKQKELAELMGVSPQQVSKIIRAQANLTFETLDKIEEALEIIISSPIIKTKREMHSQTITSVMKVVHNVNSKPIEANYSTSGNPEKNPVLDTTIENMDYYDYTAEQI